VSRKRKRSAGAADPQKVSASPETEVPSGVEEEPFSPETAVESVYPEVVTQEQMSAQASLALGKEGSLNAISHLKLMADQVDLDLSGIYAILALEKMGRRSESLFSSEETSSWKRSLVKTIEFDSDSRRVGESVVTLARFHDRGTNEILISLVERETSSMVLRRKVRHWA
jgi:hypothetical protein